MRRSIRTAAVICAAIMSVSAMSAVSYADNTAAGQTAVSAQSESKTAKAKNVSYGKVTAVNGSEITVALGELSSAAAKNDSSAAQKTKPGKKTADSAEATSGTTAGKPSVKKGKKGTAAGFTENGSTTTVTLAENNTLGKKGRTVSASDIAVGDIIKLEYSENGELTGVKIMGAKSGKTGSTAKEKSSKEKSTKEKRTRKTVTTGTVQAENA